jgi:hypothetical protein
VIKVKVQNVHSLMPHWYGREVRLINTVPSPGDGTVLLKKTDNFKHGVVTVTQVSMCFIFCIFMFLVLIHISGFLIVCNIGGL